MKKSELKEFYDIGPGKLRDAYNAIGGTTDKANKIINEYKEAYNRYISAKSENECREYGTKVRCLSRDFEDVVKEYNKRVDEFMNIPVTIAYNNTLDYIVCVFDGNINNLKSCVSYVTEYSFKDTYKVKFRDSYKVMGAIGYNTIVEPESLCDMTYWQPKSIYGVYDIKNFLDGFLVRNGMFQQHEVDLEHAQEIADKYKFVEGLKFSAIDELGTTNPNAKTIEEANIDRGDSHNMKVKELIKELQKFDPEKEVVVMGNNAVRTCDIEKVFEVTESSTKYGCSNGDIGKILIA